MANLLYIVVYPAAQATPTNVQIVAGQDATGSAALYATSRTKDTSGDEIFDTTAVLTGGASYKTAAVWFDGTSYSNVEESAAWVQDTATAVHEAAMTAGAALSSTQGRTASFEASAPAATTLSTDQGRTASFEASTSYQQLSGLGLTGGALLETAVAASKLLGASYLSSAQYAPALAFIQNLGAVSAVQADFAAGLTSGLTQEAASSAAANFLVSVALNKALGAQYTTGFTSYQDVVLADNPVAYWRLGETEGTVVAVDEMGNHDATYVNGPTLGEPGLLVGDVDKAVALNGIDQYVRVDDAAALDLAGDFSLEVWVQINIGAPEQQRMLYRYDVALASGYSIMITTSDGTPRFRTWGMTLDADIYGATTIKDGDPHHLVAVRSGTSAFLYVDGALEATASVSSDVINNDADLHFGRDASGISWMQGVVDDAAIYHHALTPQQIATHHAWGRFTGYERQVRASGPVAYWRLGETEGTVVAVDEMGNHDATYVNGPTLGEPGLLTGSGTSVSFDGSSQYAHAAAPASIAGAAAATIEAWIKTNTASETAMTIVLVGPGPGSGDVLYFAIDSHAGLYGRFRLGLGGGYRAASSVDLRDGAAHHIVATIPENGTSDDIKLYIDGLRLDDASSNGTLAKNTYLESGTDIAVYNATSYNSTPPERFFSGSVAQVAIYDRALTPAEIANHFVAGTTDPVGGTTIEGGILFGLSHSNAVGGSASFEASAVYLEARGTLLIASAILEASATYLGSHGMDYGRNAILEAVQSFNSTHGMDHGGNAILEASATYLGSHGMDHGGNAILEASATYLGSHGMDHGGNAILEAVQSFNSTQQVDLSSVAFLSASASFGAQEGAAVDGSVTTGASTISAEVAYGLINAFVSATGPNTLAPRITVGVVQSIDALSTASLFAASTFGSQLALTASGGGIVEGAVSYAIAHDHIQSVGITVEGSLLLGVEQAMAGGAQSDLSSSIVLAHQVAVQSAATAVMQAGLSLSSIQNVTSNGSILQFDLVLPSGRTVTVKVENRTVHILAEDREVTLQ